MISLDSSEFRTKTAHKISRYFIKEISKDKKNLIIEEIFRKKDYEETFKILKKENYKIYSFFLHADKKDLISRDRNRDKIKERN